MVFALGSPPALVKRLRPLSGYTKFNNVILYLKRKRKKINKRKYRNEEIRPFFFIFKCTFRTDSDLEIRIFTTFPRSYMF